MGTATYASFPYPGEALALDRTFLGNLRARRTGLLILAIWIMNSFDLMLTLIAHQQGLLVEANPIAHAILPYGPLALTLFKIGLVAFGTCVLIHQRRRILAECMAWLVVAVYVAVSFRWMVCYQLYEFMVAYDHSGAGTPVVLGLCS